ncbi:aminopeptidase [Rummeliibacillus pycnus]|uniref:aminopeptidase n=1 Tax=Rummeliibacillus pycnus TaxID=101070 RepID=UPI003D2E8078
MNLNTIVKNLMINNFSLEKPNHILVIGDHSTAELAKLFELALTDDGWKSDLYLMEDRTKDGEEPPAEVAQKMLNYEVVFCLTKYSLTHTLARRNANEIGTSVITMPGITEDMFINGAMRADYSRVEKETLEQADKLTTFANVKIQTGEMYELSIPIGTRKGIPSSGVFREKAASGNLPSGEAFIAPLEGEANGEILITGSIAGIGLVNEPVLITIENGRLINATGEQGKHLLEILGEGNGRMLAELGIGTNYEARIIGRILEDEKAYNTIHVAFGSNHTFGGTIQADVHIDCVTKNPKIIWS